MPIWSMKRRLIGSLIGYFALFWIAGVAIAGFIVRHEINEVFDSALRETAGHLVPVALDVSRRTASDQSPVPEELAVSYSASRGHVYYLLRDRAGAVLLASEGTPVNPHAIPLKSGFFDHGDSRVFARLLSSEGVWIVVAQELVERRDTFSELWLGLTSPLLALLPIAAFAVWRTVGRATEPISRVSNELEARGGNDLRPIDAAGMPTELIPVVEAANTLMVRLKAALDSERAFAANAAHELRNPIAAARAQIQLLADDVQDAPSSLRAENVVSQLARLGRRIEKLLQMTRAEAGLGHTRERSDLIAIAALVVEDFRQQPNVGARLRFQVDDRDICEVAMDQEAIGIVLRNAIENAVHHGIDTEPIEVSVTGDRTVRVVNACHAVPPQVLRRLTDRFQRGNARQAVGSGLGLTIMDMIMRQAGGSAALASPAEGRADGFEVVLSFPGAT